MRLLFLVKFENVGTRLRKKISLRTGKTSSDIYQLIFSVITERKKNYSKEEFSDALPFIYFQEDPCRDA